MICLGLRKMDFNFSFFSLGGFNQLLQGKDLYKANGDARSESKCEEKEERGSDAWLADIGTSIRHKTFRS